MPKDDEIRNVNTRRKNILYLMQRYLHDNGFYNSAEALRSEARLPDELEVCDNIDLDGIYLEYASYYYLKFGKYPKILRKAKQPIKAEVAVTKRKGKPAASGTTESSSTTATPNEARKKSTTSPKNEASPAAQSNEETADLEVVVRRIETSVSTVAAKAVENEVNEDLTRLREIDHGSGIGVASDELLGSQEWQTLADLVKTTIMREDSKLSWADICGNTNAIDIVKEAVLAPIKYPKVFEANGLRPWKSVLLHGPPGSGKTLLAKVLYAETRTCVTFFNVTSSVVISKWRGESEKMLKLLFHLAHKYRPSVIFFDEIEGLTSRRDRPTDHESSKRFKNELLQLFDGMEQQSAGVFILASTNLPWDIDDAFLRRFEKKLLVQLPNAVERAKLIGKLLPLCISVSAAQMESLVSISENFTGDEIRLACKEISMQTVRRVTQAKLGEGDEAVPLECAFQKVKPLSVKLMHKHVQWQNEHGSA